MNDPIMSPREAARELREEIRRRRRLTQALELAASALEATCEGSTQEQGVATACSAKGAPYTTSDWLAAAEQYANEGGK